MEQAEAIWDGKHIGSRYDKEDSILLYRVENIYVEVYYNQTQNIIRKFIPYSRIEDLMPYLGQYENL
jgi:hypothetical protein